jgi:hypothetical protein
MMAPFPASPRSFNAELSSRIASPLIISTMSPCRNPAAYEKLPYTSLITVTNRAFSNVKPIPSSTEPTSEDLEATPSSATSSGVLAITLTTKKNEIPILTFPILPYLLCSV